MPFSFGSATTSPPLPSAPAALEEEEESLLEAIATATTGSDRLVSWNKQSLHNLFGLCPWEETQLYGILNELGVTDRSLEGKYFIAGGSLVRHLMNTEIAKGDIDIYPLDLKNCMSVVEQFKDKGYKLTKSKFSYYFSVKMGLREIKVQVMHGNTGGMLKVMKEFDFEHVRVGYQMGIFYSTLAATTAIAQKKLHLRYVREPTYTLLRALKYQKLGFNADEAITKLAWMIKENAKNVSAAEWEAKHPIIEY